MSLVVSGANGVAEPGIITIGTASGLWLSLWANLDTLASGDDPVVEFYDSSNISGLTIGIQDDFGSAPGVFMLRILGESSSASGFFNAGFDITSDPTSGWHHAFVYIPFGTGAQTRMRAWWDGTEATITDYSGGGTYTGGISGGDLNIGYGLDVGGGVDGNVAEVGVWSSAAAPSASEISDLSNSSGATRPGDLTTSATLIAYAPLETDYALTTPTGTLTDIGTGATSIVSGTHPTMASASTTITLTGTGGESSASTVTLGLGRLFAGTGAESSTASVTLEQSANLNLSGTGAETSSASVTLEQSANIDLSGTGADASAATVTLAASRLLATEGLPAELTVMRHYAFGVSLWCFDPGGPNQADVGNVMDQIAAAGTGLTYGGAGDFASAFTPSMLDSGDYPAASALVDNMPLGTSHWGGSVGISGTGTTHAVLMDNNINFPSGLTPNAGWGNDTGAEGRITDVVGEEAGCTNWFLFSGEPDMAGATEFGGGGTPYTSSTWLSTYLEAYQSDNEALQDDIQTNLDTAGTDVELKLIPASAILARLLQAGGLLDDFAVDELYVDDAPHRNQTANLVVGAICFSAMYQRKVPDSFDPSTFTPPGAGSVDQRVIDRWAGIVDEIWLGLLEKADRVFGRSVQASETSFQTVDLERSAQALGTGAEASTSTVSLGVGGILQGTGAESSQATVALSRELSLDAAGAESSNASVALSRESGLVGTGSETSDATATLSREITFSSVGAEASASDADLSRELTLAPTGAESSSSTTTLAREQGLTGTGAETSSSTVTLQREVSLTASGAESSTSTTILTQAVSGIFEGTGSESSASTVALSAQRSLAGTGAEASSSSINLGRAVRAESASSESSSSTATLSKALTLFAAGNEVGDAVVQLVAERLLAAIGSEISSATADIATAGDVLQSDEKTSPYPLSPVVGSLKPVLHVKPN